jgi:hypothetical protein
MVAMTIPDKSRTYAYLFAESATVSLDQIQEILRASPDETTQMGDPIPHDKTGRVRPHTTWTLYALSPSDEHFGLRGLTRWLEDLDNDLAERFQRLAELGVDVGINIVQNVDAQDDDDIQSNLKNFELSPRALRWLADAGATHSPSINISSRTTTWVAEPLGARGSPPNDP